MLKLGVFLYHHLRTQQPSLDWRLIDVGRAVYTDLDQSSLIQQYGRCQNSAKQPFLQDDPVVVSVTAIA